MTEMKKFNTIFDGLINSMAVIAGVFIAFQILVECYEVVARYLLRNPPIWGLEFCEYTLFLLAFLATTWVLKTKSHITVNIVLERLRPGTQNYCHLFASFAGIVISLIIFWYSLKTSWECYVVGVKVVKTYAQPKWIFLAFISLGYLMLSIEFIRQFLGYLRDLGSKKEEAQAA